MKTASISRPCGKNYASECSLYTFVYIIAQQKKKRKI